MAGLEYEGELVIDEMLTGTTSGTTDIRLLQSSLGSIGREMENVQRQQQNSSQTTHLLVSAAGSRMPLALLFVFHLGQQQINRAEPTAVTAAS
jgi:hypothetical protein